MTGTPAPTQVPLKTFVAPPPTLSLPKSSEPPKAVAAATPAVATETGTLQLTTTPAGATFAIYAGVIAGSTAPAAPPLHSGTAPESIADIPPGRYTIFLHNDGWPDDRTEVSLKPGESLPIDYIFPHGTVTITSTPDGAEIFLGEHTLGRTPLTVDLPIGKQQLTGRHSDFPERTQTVAIEKDKPANITFQFRARSRSSSKAKPKPTPTALHKIGNTLKKVFGSKPSPSPTKSRKKR